MPNPSIKDEKLYQDLRKQGDSKEKAARISNAAAVRGRSSVGKSGGDSGSYDDWTVPQLKKRGQRAWNLRLFEPDQEHTDQQTTKPLSDQRARIGPAIGAPMVSVTNIRIIKNHPAPCQPHQTPWSRQTR